MFKKFSLAVVAVVLMAGSVMADDIISASDLDSADVTSTAIESSVEAVGGGIADVDESATEAVEACFRNWGGCGGCYNYCYRPCYHNYCYQPCYNYCYQPVVCYRPVCYTTYHTYTCYQPCYYNLCSWGCY